MSIDCFVVPPRNDVIAKPTKEGEAILVRRNKFNITLVSRFKTKNKY